MTIILNSSDGQYEVSGRLAKIILYLAVNQKRLDLDPVENGQMHLSWSMCQLKGWTERYLPPVVDQHPS